MLIKNEKGFYEFTEFSEYGVIHGFSTVGMGSMRQSKTKKLSDISNLAAILDIPLDRIIGTHQVHGDLVTRVNNEDKGTIIRNGDGLLTTEENLFLYITVADCLPILFFDKLTRMTGLTHAGRRGVFSEIVPRMIDKMIEAGAQKRDILIGIGPSIRACCYDISKDLAMEFSNKFKFYESFITMRDGKTFLDLETLVFLQSENMGIMKSNIIKSGICTKDNQREFYSYRGRNGKKTNEVFAAIIGRNE